MRLCDYGCGQEATYKFGSGRWCCSKSHNQCPKRKEKTRRNTLEQWKDLSNKINSRETKEKISKLLKGRKPILPIRIFIKDKVCDWECGNISNYQFKNGKVCCCDNVSKCKKNIEKNRNFQKSREKDSIQTRERKRKAAILRMTKNRREELKSWMKNGHAVYMLKFHRNPSKEQIDLYKIVSLFCPYVELNYPLFRIGKGKRSYSIDIAVPKLDLAIEFDGYFHFDTEEHKEYHNKRQKEIEEEGWKFLRYNIFQKFPSLENLKEDIERIL